MKISIDTQTDDFASAVGAVHSAYGYESSDGDKAPNGKVNGNGSAMYPGGWTDKKLRKWAGLLRPDAQEVVRYVAAHAPEVGWDAAAEHLGHWRGEGGPVDGKFLGGAMSSGGHALNRIPGKPKGQPIDRDYTRRMYVIDIGIAAILANALGEPGEPGDGDGVEWEEE